MPTWPDVRLGLEILISTCLSYFIIFNVNVIRRDDGDWVLRFSHHVSQSWLATIILLGYNTIAISIVFLVRVWLALCQRKRLQKELDASNAEEIRRLRRDRGLMVLRDDVLFGILSAAYFRAIGHNKATGQSMPLTDLDEMIYQSHQLINSGPPHQNAKNLPPWSYAQDNNRSQWSNRDANKYSDDDTDSWSGISASGANLNDADNVTILTSPEKADRQPVFPRTDQGHSPFTTVRHISRPCQPQQVAGDWGVTTSADTGGVTGRQRPSTASMSPEKRAKESARKTAQKKRKLQAAKLNSNSRA